MASGYMLTQKQIEMIRETVKRVMNQYLGSIVGRSDQQVQRQLTVVLDESLSAATNAATTPATATASVLQRTSGGDLIDSERDITLVNRFEHIAIDANTLATAMWIDGEWRLSTADCEPLDAETLTDLTPTPEEEPP